MVKPILTSNKNENNQGWRRLLTYPWWYDSAQILLGGRRARKILLNEYIRPQANDRILDLGCGTGNIFSLIQPEILYHGYDYNEQYINYAKKKYGKQAQFYCLGIEDIATSNHYDKIIVAGVLHHLSDAEITSIADHAVRLLDHGGMATFFEPIWTESQSPITRWFLKQDRGKNIKDESGYRQVLSPYFSSITCAIRDDLFYIPYTKVIIQAMP